MKSKIIVVFLGLVFVLIATYLILIINFSDYLFSNVPLKVESKNLKETIITPYLEHDIDEGKNLVFCSTFQLAWNELKDDIVKENIQLQDNPPIVKHLNASVITKEDISEDSYVAMAGFAKDDIIKKINNVLRTKFPDVAPKVEEGYFTEKDIFVYAFLFKNLQFKYRFESLKEPIAFNSHYKKINVKAFGIEEYSEKKHKDMGKQVDIFSFEDRSNFIVRLTSDNFKNDEVVLAKIKPEKTLLKTIKTVENHIENSESYKLHKESSLQIPKFNFDIKHSYLELIGKYFGNKGLKGNYIGGAMQDIVFKLDEKGVLLLSDVKLPLPYKSAPRELIFNRPFLIYLKEKNGEYPYFAMWVDNPELMVKE